MLRHPKTPFIFGSVLILGFAIYIAVTYPLPGSLSTAHAGVKGLATLARCTSCHAPAGRAAGCLGCHREIAGQLETDRGYHAHLLAGGEPECAGCHPEHIDGDFAIIGPLAWQGRGPEGFDHPHTPFHLEGRHAGLSCEDCHHREGQAPFTLPDYPSIPRPRTFLGLTQECAHCHEQVHGEGLYPACSDCHGQEKFKPPAHFDHDEHFVLANGHAGAPCDGCHVRVSPEGSGALSVGLRGTRCVDCHPAPHRVDWERDCESCHPADASPWSRGGKGLTIAAHALTGFRLDGPHGDVACESCHPESPSFAEKYPDPASSGYRRRRDTCEGCHRDVHGGQFLAAHPHCVDCHDSTHFVPAALGPGDHDIYPLEGAHLGAECNDCHRTGSRAAALLSSPEIRLYRGTPRECSACHRDVHLGQFQQGGVTRCERCHASAHDWTATRFDHDRDSRFPLEGAHARVDCAVCHPRVLLPGDLRVVQYRPLSTKCEDCHGIIQR